MVVHTSTALWLGAVGAGSTAMVALAVVSRRHWEEPGGHLFSALLVTLAATGTAGGVWLATTAPTRDVLGELFPLGAFLAPVVWGAFTARRTGVPGVTRRRTVALTAFVAVSVTLQRVAAWLGDAVDVALPGAVEAALTAAVAVVNVGGTLVAVSLVVVGVGLVAYSVVEYEQVGRWRGATLALAAVVAWFGTTFANGLMYADDPDATLSAGILGAALVASATLFWLSVARFGLFEQSVAAGTIGRDEVVETMEDAVVVVDVDGRVVDLNPVARRLFEVEMDEAAGEGVEGVVGEPLGSLREDDLLALDTLVGVREFEPRSSPVSSADGDLLGFSVVLRDVTERRTREERLAVLNRVLRHNVRNEVSIITGYAELLGEAGVALDHAATEINETAHELAEIGEKARVIERVMSEPAGADREVAVADAVERAVDPVRSAFPDCTVAVDVPGDLSVAANPNVLVPALENVVENGAEHNDADQPRVEVTATEGVDPTTVTVTVVDNGPGIPETERTVVDSGDVTPLEHGSGLGLWIAKWGVTRLGGELSFAPTEPRGTVVTLKLPVDGPDAEAPGVDRHDRLVAGRS